jgi:uncharacterized protein (DUF2147 family)
MGSKRLAALAFGLSLCLSWPGTHALARTPDGTWLISDRVAIQVFDCDGLFCGRIVWLRQPALRTPALCGRTIIWGLTPTAPNQWSNGSFFDPENATTYNLSAALQPDGTNSARIYEDIALFGRTEILQRINPHSRPGWC